MWAWGGKKVGLHLHISNCSSAIIRKYLLHTKKGGDGSGTRSSLTLEPPQFPVFSDERGSFTFSYNSLVTGMPVKLLALYSYTFR